MLRFIQKPEICFALQNKWPVFMNGFIWNETLGWNELTHSGSISTVFQYFLAANWAALKLKRKLANYILIFLENVDKTCK